jgi:hypothetical protein
MAQASDGVIFAICAHHSTHSPQGCAHSMFVVSAMFLTTCTHADPASRLRVLSSRASPSCSRASKRGLCRPGVGYNVPDQFRENLLAAEAAFRWTASLQQRIHTPPATRLCMCSWLSTMDMINDQKQSISIAPQTYFCSK